MLSLLSTCEFMSSTGNTLSTKFNRLYQSTRESRKNKFKERIKKKPNTSLEAILRLKTNKLNRLLDCCDEEYTEVYGMTNAGMQCTVSAFFNLVVSDKTSEYIKSIYKDKAINLIVDKLTAYKLIKTSESRDVINFLSKNNFKAESPSKERFNFLVDLFKMRDAIEMISVQDIKDVSDFIRRSGFPDFATYMNAQLDHDAIVHLIAYKHQGNGRYMMIDDNVTSMIDYKDITYDDIVYIYKSNRIESK